jgi:hypothetical protein
VSNDIANDVLTRRVRRLSWVVWSAVVLGLLNLVFSYPLWSYRAKKGFADMAFSFEGASVDKQVQTSSVIVLTQWRQQDGRNKCIITEILKRDPNVGFSYKAGDEYARGNLGTRPNTDYGDGEVMFFTGSLPQLRYSAAYWGDRVRALGDLPLTTLRAMIQKRGP